MEQNIDLKHNGEIIFVCLNNDCDVLKKYYFCGIKTN